MWGDRVGLEFLGHATLTMTIVRRQLISLALNHFEVQVRAGVSLSFSSVTGMTLRCIIIIRPMRFIEA